MGIIDFGGQYAHLIASRVRKLGAYTEILSNEESIDKYREYAGLIFSGGPSSVYDKDSPRVDASILDLGVPILGICYGHQLIMKLLGGKVESSPNKEYGPAYMELSDVSVPILKNAVAKQKVWMSHGDEVVELPPGFKGFGFTPDCKNAGVYNPQKNIFGIQFHPEVTHTENGSILLENFVNICNLSHSWSTEQFLEWKIADIKEQVGDRNVFILISGGVDSTVSYLLLAKALGSERVKGLLVDTGFMRLNEVDDLRKKLHELGVDLLVADESERYYTHLKGKTEPEEKRKIIGQLFIDCKNDIAEKYHLNDTHWLLGQGTIYPDTIESGGTKHSHTIKTHHNRVQAVMDLMSQGKIIEPIRDLYKDEVRELGTLLGLEPEWVARHPFPGPGLAVRMISSNEFHDESAKKELAELLKDSLKIETDVLPVKSVGVQGDQRSYSSCAVLSDFTLDWNLYDEVATKITNNLRKINRVVFLPFQENFKSIHLTFKRVELDREHSDILRQVDDRVTKLLYKHSLINEIWQMPVVLIPVGDRDSSYSVVLRPIESREAMTANFYRMDRKILKEMVDKILEVKEIAFVFYDLTNKPPGTIEWE